MEKTFLFYLWANCPLPLSVSHILLSLIPQLWHILAKVSHVNTLSTRSQTVLTLPYKISECWHLQCAHAAMLALAFYSSANACAQVRSREPLAWKQWNDWPWLHTGAQWKTDQPSLNHHSYELFGSPPTETLIPALLITEHACQENPFKLHLLDHVSVLCVWVCGGASWGQMLLIATTLPRSQNLQHSHCCYKVMQDTVDVCPYPEILMTG